MRSRGRSGVAPGLAGGLVGTWGADRWAQVRRYRHWIYVGVRAIAQEICRHQPNIAVIGKVDEGERAARTRRWEPWRTRSKAEKSQGALRPHEEVRPVSEEHPFARLMSDPNGPETRSEFWFAWTVFYKVCGIAYIWARPSGIVLDGVPLIQDLWVLPTQWVVPVSGNGRPIDHYQIRPYGMSGGGGSLEIPAEDMIVFKDPSPLFPLDGMSGLQAGSEWVDIAESQHSAEWNSFKNGAFPGTHIKLPPGVDPDDAEMDRLYAKFLSRFAGEANTSAPILTQAGYEIDALTHSPTEMGYIEGGNQSRDRILALLGVPKGVVGLEPGGDNISAYAPLRQFCRFTIAPILGRLGETLTERGARRYDRRLRLWYDDPTPDDPEQIRRDIDTRIKGSAISPNEIRALYGAEPWDPAVFPGGDRPVVQAAPAPGANQGPGDDHAQLPVAGRR